jgi:hypothetical protein
LLRRNRCREIIHTNDAVHWDIFDYNQVTMVITKMQLTSVLVTLNRIAVAVNRMMVPLWLHFLSEMYDREDSEFY